MNKGWNMLRRFCAFIIGLVFFYGGMLKLMDPVGASMVMREYFIFFHMQFLFPIAKTLGFVMALVETFTGAALVSGVARSLVAAVTSALLGFFTMLTLVLVIFNPDMDCGCFGEAVHLTHMQTFLKNILLDILALLAFLPTRDYGRASRLKGISFALTSIFALAFGIWSLFHIPPVDFTAFKCGNYIEAARDRAPGAAKNGAAEKAPQMLFIYEKYGQRESFELDCLPDSTWTFVDTQIPNDAMVELPVLQLAGRDGTYHDEDAAEGDVAIISWYGKMRGDSAGARAVLEQAGFKTFVLSTAWDEGVDYVSDYKTLLTLNRSNGGLTLIRDGRIVLKRTAMKFPDAETAKALILEDPSENLDESSRSSRLFQSFLLLESAFLLLL